ncbi:MAG TPA: hypothetical protein V6C58_03725 [Allocoleopsis sp.]
MAISAKVQRTELGLFSSVVCFKAVVVGIEDALGAKAAAIALIAAGRKRGRELAQGLGLVNNGEDVALSALGEKLNHVLGANGTRLCIVDKVEQVGDVYQVYTRETICSYAEEEGSTRSCTYTMGALQGILEIFLGKKLKGTQTGSVLRGAEHDILEYSVLG